MTVGRDTPAARATADFGTPFVTARRISLSVLSALLRGVWHGPPLTGHSCGRLACLPAVSMDIDNGDGGQTGRSNHVKDHGPLAGEHRRSAAEYSRVEDQGFAVHLISPMS